MDGIAARTEDDLFETANLFPKTTGLPMTVWVSPRGLAQQDVRVKVSQAHGNRMDVRDTAAVGVRPAPRVIAGNLAPVEEQAVSAGAQPRGCHGQAMA